MNPRQFVDTIGAHWRLVVVLILIGLLIPILWSLSVDPQYRSSARLFLAAPGGQAPTTLSTAGTSPYEGDQFSRQRAQTYVRLVTGDDFAGRVAQRLDDPDLSSTDIAQIADGISARVIPDTVLIEVASTSDQPVRARDIAAAAAEQLTDEIRSLETPAGMRIPTVDPVTIATASVPLEPNGPRAGYLVAAGGVLGLAAGVTAAGVAARLRRTVDRPEDVVDILGRPVLGSIPVGGITSPAPHDELRYNLEYLDPHFTSGVLLVTSSRAGEGKTSVVTGLSRAFAQAGKLVVTVHGDLRGSGEGEVIGLTNVVAGDVPVGQALIIDPDIGLAVLPAGPAPAEPTTVLEAPEFGRMFQQLRTVFDVVIVDSPDVARFDDARVISAHSDAVLLVVSAGILGREELVGAKAALDSVRAPVVGAVITHSDRGRDGGHVHFGYRGPRAETTGAQQPTETVTT